MALISIEDFMPGYCIGTIHSSLAGLPLICLTDDGASNLKYVVGTSSPEIPDGYIEFRLALPYDYNYLLEQFINKSLSFYIGHDKIHISKKGIESLILHCSDSKSVSSSLDGLSERASIGINDVLIEPGGYLFLSQGSNRLADQYHMSEKEAQHQTMKVMAVCKSRHDLCLGRGIKFLEILIPEKSSVLKPRVQDYIDGPTPLYRNLVKGMKGIDWFIDLYPHLSGFVSYTQGGTHLNFAGAAKAACVILQHLNYNVQISYDELRDYYVPYDLLAMLTTTNSKGSREQRPFYERVDYVTAMSVGGYKLVPICVHSIDPPGGEHIGVQRFYKCDKAPIDASCLCFGNSFFERGYACTQLTWHFARLFKTFAFIWSPHVNSEIIDSIKPDFVFHQTIERFLPSIQG